jgi:hypothetical protein
LPKSKFSSLHSLPFVRDKQYREDLGKVNITTERTKELDNPNLAIVVWWFDFRLMPISDIDQAISKIDNYLKSGQM